MTESIPALDTCPGRTALCEAVGFDRIARLALPCGTRNSVRCSLHARVYDARGVNTECLFLDFRRS